MYKKRLYINKSDGFSLVDEEKMRQLKNDKFMFEENNNRVDDGKTSKLEH